MMTNKTNRTLILTALFAALTCVATMVIRVPSPTGGYVNLGDAVILLGAYLLGPAAGAIAGGIGAMLADVFAGYAAYAPATLIIKALVGLCGGLLYRALGQKKGAAFFCGIPSELVMMFGYFGYSSLLLGKGLAAAASLPGDFVQGLFGVFASGALTLALRRNAYVRRQFPQL